MFVYWISKPPKYIERKTLLYVLSYLHVSASLTIVGKGCHQEHPYLLTTPYNIEDPANK